MTKRDAMWSATKRWLKTPAVVGIDVARFDGDRTVTKTRSGVDRLSVRGLIGPGMFRRLRSVDLGYRLRLDLIEMLIASLRRLGCEVERYTVPGAFAAGQRLRVEMAPGGRTRLTIADQPSDRPEDRPA